MTTNHVSNRDGVVFGRVSRHDLPVPEPLGALLLRLLADGKSHTGIGSSARRRWLFPGGTPKVVQERLGHATISITLDTYSHVIPTMQRAAANRFAAAVFGP